MTRIKVGRDGRCSLAHPLAEPGEQPGGAVIWAVEGVPPEVTPAEVLEVFAVTAGWRRGYRVRFDELGPSRVVRHPIEDDPEAWSEPDARPH